MRAHASKNGTLEHSAEGLKDLLEACARLIGGCEAQEPATVVYLCCCLGPGSTVASSVQSWCLEPLETPSSPEQKPEVFERAGANLEHNLRVYIYIYICMRRFGVSLPFQILASPNSELFDF